MGGRLAIVVVILIVMELMVVSAVIYAAVRAYWSPIADRFPPREPASDAVRRHFQSFGAVLLNLGWCIHVAADDRYLHLRPARFARLIGIRPASIPWEAITPDPSDRRRRVRRANVGGHSIEGPRWCIDLAAPPPPPLP